MAVRRTIKRSKVPGPARYSRAGLRITDEPIEVEFTASPKDRERLEALERDPLVDCSEPGGAKKPTASAESKSGKGSKGTK